MSENEHQLRLELINTRQQLEAAQNRIVQLETTLSSNIPPPNSSTNHHILDHLLEGCQIISHDWRYLYVNEVTIRQGHQTREQLLGRTMMECYPGIENTPMFALLRRCMEERTRQQMQNEFTYPDGSRGLFELSIQPIPEGIFILSLDITERQRAENILLERDERLNLFVEHAPAAIAMLDNNMRYLLVSQRWLSDYHLHVHDVIGRSHYDIFPDLPERWKEIHERCLKGSVESSAADLFPRADGRVDWVRWEIYPWRKADGKIGGIFIFSEVITERIEAEQRITKLYRTLTVLSDVNQAIVRIRRLHILFNTICQIAVEKGGFHLVWIGLLDTTSRKVNPAAYAGTAGNYLKNLNGMLEEDPIAIALRTGQRVVVNDIEGYPAPITAQDKVLQAGCRSFVTLPLKVGGEIRGSLNLYVTETNFFDDDELRLLDEMAGDLSFAMEFAEEEQQRTKAEEALQRYIWRMQILHEIDLGIIQGDSIPALVESTLKNVRGLIPCQRAIVALPDRATNEGIIFAVDFEGDSIFRQGARVPITPDVLEGFDAMHMRLINDLRPLQEFHPRAKEMVSEGMISALNVLLMDQKTPIGTFALLANTSDFFTPEYQDIALQVANQLAIAIRQMRLSEEMTHHAAMLEQRVEERTADLQAAKERVETILNHSADGILMANAELRIQQANPAFLRLFVCQSDYYFDKSLLDLVQPENTHPLEKAIVEGISTHLEVSARRRDGTTFDAEFSIGHIANGGLVCTIRDITAHKTNERQLRYYGAIQSSMNDAVVVTDMQFNIQSWNTAAERIYGWSADEARGKNAGDILLPQYTTDVSDEQVIQAFLTEGAWQGEVIQHHKDGHVVNVQSSVTLFKDENGIPFGIVAVNRDITEHKKAEAALKESEARFRSFFEQPLVGMSVTTPDKGVTLVNDKLCDMLGYTREEFLQLNWADITHPLDMAAETQQFERVLAGEIDGYSLDKRFIRKDGSLIYTIMTCRSVRDNQGKVMYFVALVQDITDRKKAEVELKRREEQYRTLANNLPGTTIFLFDRDYRYFLVEGESPVRTKAYMEGKTVQEIFVGDELADLLPGYQAALRGETARIERHTDTGRIYDGQFVPIRQDDGTVSAGLLVVRDITAEREAEQRLNANEARFRLVLNSVKDYAILTLLPDGTIASWGPGAEQIKGYKEAEILGQNFALFYTLEARVAGEPERNLEIARSQGHIAGEGWQVRKDGTRFWAAFTLTALRNPDGRLMGFTKITHDLTEHQRAESALRDSETRFRSLMEAAPLAIVISEQAGRIILVNKQAEMLLGYTRDELIGQPVEILVPLNVRERHINNRAVYLADPRVRPMGSGLELEARRKDGTQFPVEIELSHIETHAGILVMSYIVDITERKRNEATLRDALEKEREVSRLKTQFISTASHEFRTPLATILASTETLTAYRAKMDDTQIEQRLDKIRSQVAHLKGIMDDVLELARMQARRTEFKPLQANLHALCREIIDEFHGHPSVEHHIHYTCQDGMPEIHFDSNLMRRIVSNLLGNAIKYSPEKQSVYFHIGYNADEVFFTVRDEGIGIPEVDLKHLFEPFHRADNVETIPGTGLGLSIVKEGVELHGGTIAVESVEGSGTTFTVHIPL